MRTDGPDRVWATLRRWGGAQCPRAALAIALAEGARLVASGPWPPAWRMALAGALAAATALLLAMAAADDRALRALLVRLRGLDRGDAATATVAASRPAAAVPALAGEVARIAGRFGAVERRLVHRHPVSGLATREPLFRHIAEAIAADRPGTLGILHLLDLDRLHAFNEAMAEQLLVALAARVTRMVGPHHRLAQVDRARLAIWFPAHDAASAQAELAAIGYALGEAIRLDGREVSPKVRVTSAELGTEATTPAMLLACATRGDDGADARATGADAAAAPLLTAQQGYALEQDLRRAIDRNELALAFQPLVDAQAGRVCGAEALLRWQHPALGAVSPARFVPVMEAAGLADEIGLWALNAACRQAGAWRRQGLDGLRVAVNISGHQLAQGDLVTLVERTLSRHSLTADMLEIELTETVATGETGHVTALFRRLRRLGVTIAIDDFGTGYSSLRTLRTLGFNKIKIDREFVTAVDRRRDSQAICRSILALGQGLNLRVLAEGVETAAEYRWMREAGCRHFQGYYFARPLDPAGFAAFVGDQAALARLLQGPFPVPERLRA